MSARARVKLCSGLAKIGWLSKRKFQAIFPRIKRISRESDLGEVTFYAGGTLLNPLWSEGENCDIAAGESIRAVWKGQYDGAVNWKIKLYFDDGSSVIVGGKCGGVGGKVPAYLDVKKQSDFIESKLLTPLDGQNWYYTEALQQAFGLLRNNENVGTYPNCRRWSKD